VRTWTITRSHSAPGFYVAHGDWLAVACALLSLLVLALSFTARRTKGNLFKGDTLEDR